MQSETPRIHATLAQLASKGADAGRIADTAVSTWREIDAALAPIIGKRGFAALYKRSLYLTRADYPWLAAALESALEPGELADLQTALAQQTSSNAASANDALLRTFCDLLTKLVGESLTERLLRSVWDNPSRGHSAQDTLR